jgi:hypothetical protein
MPGVPGATSFPSSSRMRGSYPGTATPVVPGRTAPGRFGQEDVQHLGHADAVEPLDAEMRRPPLHRSAVKPRGRFYESLRVTHTHLSVPPLALMIRDLDLVG